MKTEGGGANRSKITKICFPLSATLLHYFVGKASRKNKKKNWTGNTKWL